MPVRTRGGSYSIVARHVLQDHDWRAAIREQQSYVLSPAAGSDDRPRRRSRAYVVRNQLYAVVLGPGHRIRIKRIVKGRVLSDVHKRRQRGGKKAAVLEYWHS